LRAGRAGFAFAFALGALALLGLTSFFGEGLDPRRACFLE
jgi:hypothetical protein